MEDGFSALPPKVPDVGNLGSEIPGLDSAVHSVGLAETPIVSSLAPTDLEDASQEQGTSLGSSVMELVPSISTDRSEELSPKVTVTDTASPGTPTGHFAVYVGEERQRFVVPTGFLSHPLFKMLLDKAYDEFGFQQRDGLVVPCSVAAFQEVVSAVQRR
ncbi:auxin-responsive protein SAUR21-like [Camellia sinensis]|uniref:auxin-responsive protein SAUR21-like n=1 Tax=Camellia sinensis TaxID=4442 RepID=UPI0010364C3D|nr:auxin-responsive protein SAUR21-like [Camellia sinensis]